MSALALIALRRGLAVSGSDEDIAGCGDLIAAGATIMQGRAPALAAAARAVIVSAAIPDEHPEVQAARSRGLAVVPRKHALARLIGKTRSVAIAGTHGKTTTTVMTTEALRGAGLGVTGIAGGRVDSWGGNALIGGEELFVVEADEYDKAFLTLDPTVAVVNNVEADHLECYGSLEALEQAFVAFAGRAERVLIGNDSEGADRVAAGLPADRVWRFGPSAPDIRVESIESDPAGSRATIMFPTGGSASIALQVPGMHNLRNATAALGVVAALGGNLAAAAAALASFGGVGRRFERLGESAGVMFVDDYAHHPTEVRATLAAARQAFPGRRLVAVFQPHLYSRTAEHGDALGEALAAADFVVVADVYPAREAPIPGVTGERVANAARDRGVQTVYEPVRDALGERVAPLLNAGDVVLTLGAGDITRLGPELRGRLARA
jgi:UDP-N-acetylmuramate--alanine ligase